VGRAYPRVPRRGASARTFDRFVSDFRAAAGPVRLSEASATTVRASARHPDDRWRWLAAAASPTFLGVVTAGKVFFSCNGEKRTLQ
jgi:hypothetical protein